MIQSGSQVFGLFPNDKYEKVGFARIAEMIGFVIGPSAAQDFIARLAFTILTGNGDMHLKNWSLIYPDGRKPQLSPAYDLVSTVPYLPRDRLALNFPGKKEFAAVNRESIRRLAGKAALSEHETLATVARIADAVKASWPAQHSEVELPPEIADRITSHILTTTISLSEFSFDRLSPLAGHGCPLPPAEP